MEQISNDEINCITASCIPVPFFGHSSHGLFQAAPTEQQHLLRNMASAIILLHELGPGPWVKAHGPVRVSDKK